MRVEYSIMQRRQREVSLALAVCGLLLVWGAGCATSTAAVKGSAAAPAQPPLSGAPVDTASFSLPPAVGPIVLPGEVVEKVPGGAVDWSGRVVRARGTGVIDPGAANPAQARLMAERAAVAVAQRNLLEIIKGVRVSSETRVENFMTDYDVVYTRVEGMVKGARQTGPARYDSLAGTVEVELEIPLYENGLADAVIPVLGPEQAATPALTPEVKQFLQQYSALVLDGSEAGLKPSLFPRIYDAKGNLLLDTRQYAGYLGSGGQAALNFVADLNKVLSRPELAGVPLVLKVKQVTGKLGADIVLEEKDADKVRWLKEGFKFLAQAGKFLLKILL